MTLIDRIEQGMITETDARIVLSIIARLAAYDLALREIAVCGMGDATVLAARVLTEGRHEPARHT